MNLIFFCICLLHLLLHRRTIVTCDEYFQNQELIKIVKIKMLVLKIFLT